MNVRPVLGTMNFGPQVTQDESIKMVEEFISQGYSEFDTAYVYNNGDSEKFLGHAIKNKKKLVISTKVNPRVTGKLDKKSIKFQFSESLKRLGVSKVDILYLHFPDPSTPIRETLEAISELKNDGQINELGLSNYSSKEVISICKMCDKHQLLMPSVYQGLYNCLSKNIEELFAAIRKFEIRFYAYNPLAGGILTGKHANINSNLEGRFSYRLNYRDRYLKKEFFLALDKMKNICKVNKITLLEASLRWLIHHSKLDVSFKDAIVVGTSNIVQLKQNLFLFKTKPLENNISDEFNSIGDICKKVSPLYYRTVT